MKKLFSLFSILVLAMVLGIFAGSAFAEIPAGEYNIEVDGVAFPGKVILADNSFFAIGEGWCFYYDTTGIVVGCGTHVWNSEQDVFLYDGQVLFTVPGPIELISAPDPCADGFSPSEGCQ